MIGKKGAGSGLLLSTTSMNNSHNRQKTLNRRYLCLIVSFILLLTVSFIFIAWSVLCDIDTGSMLKLQAADNIEEGQNRSTEFQGRHTVEIYYEVLCPDSKYFILNQFIPAYKKFRSYIRPVLVPYGKAITRAAPDGKLKFECQHGQIECEGNTLHACAIHHISNEHLLVSFIHCLMKSNTWKLSDFERVGEKCANEYQVSWYTLKTCWKSEAGLNLLKLHGEATQALSPAVSFIPTVVVDQSQSYQKDILKDFKGFLCKRVLSRNKENFSLCH